MHVNLLLVREHGNNLKVRILVVKEVRVSVTMVLDVVNEVDMQLDVEHSIYGQLVDNYDVAVLEMPYFAVIDGMNVNVHEITLQDKNDVNDI